MLPDLRAVELRLAALGHGRAAAAALASWLALHQRWSRVANLTGTKDAEELLALHISDAVVVTALMPPGPLLDVGSGSGLPGLIIAALEPKRAITLVDAAAKRTRFCEQAALEMGLEQVTVVHARAEDHRPEVLPTAVVARAVAPLPRLVGHVRHLLDAGVPLLAMKGPGWPEEADAMPPGVAVTAVTPYEVPDTQRSHVLLRVEAAATDNEGSA